MKNLFKEYFHVKWFPLICHFKKNLNKRHHLCLMLTFNLNDQVDEHIYDKGQLLLCPTLLSFARFCPARLAFLIFAPLCSIHSHRRTNGAFPSGQAR